jgi:16S rRNA processing protein RimM
MSAPDSPRDAEGYLVVARVVRAHGTRGDLACEIITEFPQRFRRTRAVHVSPREGPRRSYSVERARVVNRGGHAQVVLKLEGIDDRAAAEVVRGALVEVPDSEAWKLPRGRFYRHQIVGLRVRAVDGADLGEVVEILETGANDVYVVMTPRGELLVPAVKQVVKQIAPERGEIVVELLPGLVPEERPAADAAEDGAKRPFRRRRARPPSSRKSCPD